MFRVLRFYFRASGRCVSADGLRPRTMFGMSDPNGLTIAAAMAAGLGSALDDGLVAGLAATGVVPDEGHEGVWPWPAGTDAEPTAAAPGMDCTRECAPAPAECGEELEARELERDDVGETTGEVTGRREEQNKQTNKQQTRSA